MTLFRKVLLGTGAVLLVAVAVGYILPRNVHVERSVTIEAPPEAVFGLVNGYARFNEWSPWASLDPNARYTYAGPAEGVGATISWVGDPATIGSGRQEIIESRPPELVRTAIEFGPQGKVTGSMTLTRSGGGTKAVWALAVDLGSNPVSRYFGLMFDGMIGNDLGRGLTGLKRVAEAPAPPASSPQPPASTPDERKSLPE